MLGSLKSKLELLLKTATKPGVKGTGLGLSGSYLPVRRRLPWAFRWNIFNFGRLKNNVRLQDAASQQQLENYRQTVLQAQGEVENAPLKPAQKIFDYWWDKGYKIHVHITGDLAVEKYLDFVEAAMQRNPRKNHRTTFHHVGLFDAAQAQRAADLGVEISANPYYL